ncbi:hypothetical protein BGZ94_004277 [Podila epigama]|nr:hypothetical protein BGZ94_004277 [Podila epigama]
MDDLLDFSALSLHSDEEKLQKSFEHSLQIHDRISTDVGPQSHEQEREESTEAAATVDSDNNTPWATLPSNLAELNPYQPGMDAQKLDAMALDPNHVFKSSTMSFPLREPSPPTQAADTTESDKKESIPEWMLADPEMTPNWTNTSTGSTTWNDSSTLNWSSSGPDLQTTVDSNALFGFPSYPTFENLPISNVIADEVHRRNTEEAGISDSITTSLSTQKTREGGFARFGNSVRGDGTVAPSFKGVSNSDPLISDADQRQQQGSASGSLQANLQVGSGSAWQTWRTSSPMDVEDNAEDEYSEHFNTEPSIK